MDRPVIGTIDSGASRMAKDKRYSLCGVDGKLLDVSNKKTLLLGRDFMQKVGQIILDILGNQIKIGNRWLSGEKAEGRFRVNSEEENILSPRTEKRKRQKKALTTYQIYLLIVSW